MNRELENMQPKHEQGTPPRKKHTSILVQHTDLLGKDEEVKKFRKPRRKILTLPLTHVVVNKHETYDISKEYEFLSQLGIGTYSKVQLAKNLTSGELVAVKMSRGENSIELLKREKEILEHLSGDYFPKVIDFKQDKMSQKAYLIMEYIEGTTLDQVVEIHEDLNQHTVVEFISQLCKMVRFLHRNRVCHRDIKPQNVIYRKFYFIVLLDLSIL